MRVNSFRAYVGKTWVDQDAGNAGGKDEQDTRYEDAPFGIFVRFGGGRGGMWLRYKGHVRASNMEEASRSLLPFCLRVLVACISRALHLQSSACYSYKTPLRVEGRVIYLPGAVSHGNISAKYCRRCLSTGAATGVGSSSCSPKVPNINHGMADEGSSTAALLYPTSTIASFKSKHQPWCVTTVFAKYVRHGL